MSLDHPRKPNPSAGVPQHGLDALSGEGARVPDLTPEIVQARRGLRALLLEVPEVIADDLTALVEAAFTSLSSRVGAVTPEMVEACFHEAERRSLIPMHGPGDYDRSKKTIRALLEAAFALAPGYDLSRVVAETEEVIRTCTLKMTRKGRPDREFLTNTVRIRLETDRAG